VFLSFGFVVAGSGCQMIGIDLEGVEDAVSALADPLVAQAVVLGFEDPESKELEALVDAGLLDTDVTIQMYLANAANAADIAKAPMNGARVVLETPDDAYGAPRTGEGTYSIDSTEKGIEYVDEDEWMLWADAGREKPSRIDVILPPAAEIDLPKHHDEGKDLGIPTWGNYPKNITEVYNRSLAAEPLETVTIPGSAFPHTGVYALGIAAMVHNSDEQLIEVNTLLSRGMSGKTRFFTLDVW
jgi:hypothetical protein